jgi:hypothetical protein
MTSPLQNIRALFTGLTGWTGAQLDPVDFALSCYLSSYLLGAVERAWGCLVGQAGSGKSEILRPLRTLHRSVSRDHLTENSFTSAYRDEATPDVDPSLLGSLDHSVVPSGPKVLIVDEFSTILSMRREKTLKILADFRAAFRGDYQAHAGNIGVIDHKHIGFGFLAASTEQLDLFLRENQLLGERMLICRVGRHLNTYDAKRTLSMEVLKTNRQTKYDLHSQLDAACHTAIELAIERVNRGELPILPETISQRVAVLTALAVMTRSGPLSSTAYASGGEAPTRFPLQLRSFGDARAIFDNRTSWIDDDYRLCRRIAQDTMPPDNFRLITALYRGSAAAAVQPISWADLYQKSKVDKETLRRQLHQWVILGLVEFSDTDRYFIPAPIAEDLAYTDFFGGLTNGI